MGVPPGSAAPEILGQRDRLILRRADAVVGVDEVGRGSLAGPVAVCAAKFDRIPDSPRVRDSKRLTAKQRRETAVWIREICLSWVVVEVWPEVATVDVRLELPSTLRVHATPAVAHGSVPSGRRWRAVTEDGGLAGPLDQPRHPVLVGFSSEKTELGTALGVARRVAVATGAVVEEVRIVTPADFEVRLR